MSHFFSMVQIDRVYNDLRYNMPDYITSVTTERLVSLTHIKATTTMYDFLLAQVMLFFLKIVAWLHT